MAETVIVLNLAEINRSVAMTSKLIGGGLRPQLALAAEPVKRDADALSLSELSGMKRARRKPPPWSIQKVGQTTHEVYIAPTQRGKRFARTDGDRRRALRFVELMYGRSYEPAFARNEQHVRASVDVWLTKVIESV